MTNEARASSRETQRHQRRFLLFEGLILLAIWLVLSGYFDPFHVGLGVATVAFVLWINRPARAIVVDRDAPTLDPLGGTAAAPIRFLRLALYLPWLFWQMLVSGVYVARLALAPRPRIAPLILRFRSRQPSYTAQVFLGNSITLTPGTLTLDIEGDELTVHAINERAADAFLAGSMARRVAALFGGAPEPLITDMRKVRLRSELRRR
jgi:multicomponent Na+:H+ antiporter subunit E